MTRVTNKDGLIALCPMFVLVALIVGFGVFMDDFYKVPLVIVFLFTVFVGMFTLRGMKLTERISIFSKGAGEQNLMLMVWIFVLAGAFARSAQEMGAVDEMVNLTLNILPANMILPGIFVASCLVSLAIGTSVGTISAILPVVIGLSNQTGMDVSMLVAATVSGAFFGDNLSFISDTTVVATRTQRCKMSDKFRTNFLIVLPAAIITFVYYSIVGNNADVAVLESQGISFLKVVPYFLVLLIALLGVNVLAVLFIGVVLTGVVGFITGSYDMQGWFSAVITGIYGMTDTILIALLAGGLLAIIRQAGGITWIIQRLTSRVSSRKGGELCMGILVALTNFCTANNTVAILSVGSIGREIAERYHIQPRMAASILDIFSCFVQGIIPYGAQLLIASGLVATALREPYSATSLMPHLLYPYLLGVCGVVAILIGYPFEKNKIKQ